MLSALYLWLSLLACTKPSGTVSDLARKTAASLQPSWVLPGAVPACSRLTLAALLTYMLSLSELAGFARIGPMELTATARMGVEYNSNINLSERNAKDDIILRPRFDLTGKWQATEFNTLTLRTGIGYEKYIFNPEFDSNRLIIAVAPDTDIEFQVRLTENLTFTVRDSLRFLQDPTDVVGVDQAGNLVLDAFRYQRIENNLVVSLPWEVNMFNTVTFSYNRFDRVALDNLYKDTSRYNQGFNLAWQRELNKNLAVGVQGSVFENRYYRPFNNNSRGWSAGPFFNWMTSEFTQLSGNLSWVVMDFDRGGAVQDNSNVHTLNGGIDFGHTLNQNWAYTIGYSHNTNYGWISNTTTVDRVGLTVLWSGFRRTEITSQLSHEWGRDSGGIAPERYRRWVFATGLGYQLGPRTSFDITYRYTDKNSDQFDRSYIQHMLAFWLSYRF